MIDLASSSKSEIKRLVTVIPDQELKRQYSLYNELQSRGVRDEIVISLIERELINRGINFG